MQGKINRWYKRHERAVNAMILLVGCVVIVERSMSEVVPDLVRDIKRMDPEDIAFLAVYLVAALAGFVQLMREMETSPGRCSIGLAVVASFAYLLVLSVAYDTSGVNGMMGVGVATWIAVILSVLGGRRSAQERSYRNREIEKLREQVCELTKRVERAEERSGQG